MNLSLQDIGKSLALFMPAAEASQRAQWICEDMGKVGFELRLAHENPPGLWAHLGTIRQTEYVVPPSGFDINSKDDNTALSGSFVTCGNLLRLSQCVKIGRDYLKDLWPDMFSHRLVSAEHLSALNEVWWIKFWRGIERIERGPKATKASSDFEWLIHLNDGLCRRKINLEVKRRPGNINRLFKTGRPHVSMDGIAKKFGPVSDDMANVVALTVFSPPSPEAWRFVEDWFQAKPHVHGLLIWTEGNLGVTPLFKRFKPEKRWAEFWLNTAEPEDLQVAGRTAGTLCTADDAPDFVRRLAALHERSKS